VGNHQDLPDGYEAGSLAIADSDAWPNAASRWSRRTPTRGGLAVAVRWCKAVQMWGLWAPGAGRVRLSAGLGSACRRQRGV